MSGRNGDGTGSYRRDYDWTETSPGVGVAETVAAATDRDPMDLDPLHRTLNVGALDRVVRPDSEATVQFEYEGCRVTVDAAGVTVRANRNP